MFPVYKILLIYCLVIKVLYFSRFVYLIFVFSCYDSIVYVLLRFASDVPCPFKKQMLVHIFSPFYSSKFIKTERNGIRCVDMSWFFIYACNNCHDNVLCQNITIIKCTDHKTILVSKDLYLFFFLSFIVI